MASNEHVAGPNKTAAAWLAFTFLLAGGLVLAMWLELLFVAMWNMPAALVVPGILVAPALFAALACRRARMLALWALTTTALIALYTLPWHPRKRFVWDLYSVRSGMSVTDVESVMGKYIKGAGRKWLVGDTVYPDDASKATGTMTYRWNDTDAANDSDWGQVQFENGRVVQVQFLPD